MKIIDGKLIANMILDDLKEEIESRNLNPCLAIINIGNNEASKIYIKNKVLQANKIGINCQVYNFLDNENIENIINLIKKLNIDNKINGIIIQSPVPKKYNEEYLCSFISQDKDVDNLNLNNEPKFLSATTEAIIELLKFEKINIKSSHVVIIGRSKIVGKPTARALLEMDATVTITHSQTKNLKEITKLADILIVSVGIPNFITKDYIKDNAVIIDVGINKQDGKIIGDVDAKSVKSKASFLSPVPGGVGPMTIAMLFKNVIKSLDRG